MAHTHRFAFSEEDRLRILSSVPKLLQDRESTGMSEWSELLDLYRKRVKFSLHASTLTEYCEKSHIPRGLRIQKGPSLFEGKDEFKEKWIAILNKCSYDLMLLLIEESLTETNKLTQEIVTLEENLKKSSNEIETFDKNLKDLKNKISGFENKIRETKIKKLQRDGRDYLQNQVYKWLERPRSNVKTKRVTWADNRSDFDSSSTDESANSSAEEGSSYNFRPVRGKRDFFDQSENSTFLGRRRARGRKRV